MAEWDECHYFAAIVVILFAPRADQAYTTAIGFLIGSILMVAIAAIVKFAVLPNVETFVGFSLDTWFCTGADGCFSRFAVAAGDFHRNGHGLYTAPRAQPTR